MAEPARPRLLTSIRWRGLKPPSPKTRGDRRETLPVRRLRHW